MKKNKDDAQDLNGKAQQQEKFVELRAEGQSYEAIAASVGVSRQTLQNWCKDLKVEIANAKAFRLDSVKAKYQLLQVHRVEQFSKVLINIREELSRRDLSEVSTERLLDLFLKFNKESRIEDLELELTERVTPFDDQILDEELWIKKRAMV